MSLNIVDLSNNINDQLAHLFRLNIGYKLLLEV